MKRDEAPVAPTFEAGRRRLSLAGGVHGLAARRARWARPRSPHPERPAGGPTGRGSPYPTRAPRPPAALALFARLSALALRGGLRSRRRPSLPRLIHRPSPRSCPPRDRDARFPARDTARLPVSAPGSRFSLRPWRTLHSVASGRPDHSFAPSAAPPPPANNPLRGRGTQRPHGFEPAVPPTQGEVAD
jgi:hypothetical protein